MKRVGIILLGIAFLIFGTLWLMKDLYGENIAGASEDIAISMVSTKINESLLDGFYDEELDGPLLKVQTDKDGNVKYIEPDTRLINKLVLDFATGVKEQYDPEEIQQTEVNFGVITGNKFLSQLPYMVTVRVQPLSVTKITSCTGFETQGINQTRYYVHCTVESRVRILAPFTNKQASINRTYQLAEAIIVGNVPENFVQVPEDEILDVT